MKNLFIPFFALMLFFSQTAISQTHNEYEISFENAVHHQADIVATFTGLENKILKLRMSRTSPGRYALHEFAKNVYDLEAKDSKGNHLPVTRPNPYQWNVSGHDGVVTITYKLFANRGDGTYSQIDETHAHLNIPATFIYAPYYDKRPIKVKFNAREDLGWKVATQLKLTGDNLYYAPNLDYFMDSPTEISNFALREYKEESNGKDYNIRLVLHHNGTDDDLDTYFEKVKAVVKKEKEVYGELPDYEFGEYTFIACYIPNASGDGMEHRNSTILSSTRALENGGLERNIGTVSHEFFHSWNVERIRPESLEPFDFEAVNMSGELWFAEGFTSYYTNLILCRAGLITPEQYVDRLSGGLNYVWNSPARAYYNPIEMSYQAPFVDAARSVDPVNRENTFISYYTYGSVLGLALDLSLRNLDGDLDLDGYMKLVWQTYGKTEIPYTVRDLQNALEIYAGEDFGSEFFTKYIFASQMPDYKSLLASVGVTFEKRNKEGAALGAFLRIRDEKGLISSNPRENGAAYIAGLSMGDVIISIDGREITGETKVQEYMANFKPNQKVKVLFERFGVQRETELTFRSDDSYATSLFEKNEKPISKKIKSRREQWLHIK